ncbi:DUF4399 domain-containing protein [Thauera sp. CAU 1555]|uniref:DUF4399 domain-containing protein n=1 Tax=Thauera sedimentorum TaxID=2767595 RepID=A0ABR9BCG7_9RHOO|nr:DUF4399 domain-containing protein [Thauera sedimentorum]MBC9072973.1 DUF4399 domain-containing protein [Thauera sedimentorum]MBD8503892.1 DUF4399 domain-containing protein [Thauera sedimentorum]
MNNKGSVFPHRALAICGAALLLALAPAAGARSPAPEGAELYFIAPTDGATVRNPVVVRFGLRGMGVAPAGVDMQKTGHHHLIIDAPLPPMDQPVPSSEQYRHFGGGQTEVKLDLPPGRHELQLLLGDHLHVPHDPPVMSKRISITVE